MKKIILIIAATAIVIAGGSFYGGMLYGKNLSKSFSPNGNFQRNAAGVNGVNRMAGGFVTGEIISKDDKSITIKDRNGGSKIIFFSDSSEISKFASGSKEDLIVGKSVSVMGKTNSDGSITAQTIQLRPNLPNPQPGQAQQ